MWVFSGDAPDCSYVFYNGTDSSVSGGSNSSNVDGDGTDDAYVSGDSGEEGQVVTYEDVADGDHNPYDDFLIDNVSRRLGLLHRSIFGLKSNLFFCW